MNQEQAYLQGFAAKCAEYGVDPAALLKNSIKLAAGNMTSIRATLAQRLMRDPSLSAYNMQNLARRASGDPETDRVMLKIMAAIKRKQALAKTLGMGT